MRDLTACELASALVCFEDNVDVNAASEIVHIGDWHCGQTTFVGLFESRFGGVRYRVKGIL